MTDAPQLGTPSLELAGAIATIRLNRPAQHNRLEIGDLLALDAILAGLEPRQDLRAVVLTASGPSFSAGYDLNALTGPVQPPIRFEHVVDRLEALPIPTLCALNGSVYGGSADLALACDFRIGVQGMKLMVPAAKIGMLYYPSGLRRFVERLGPGATKRIFLLAESFDAEPLREIGYLDRLVAPADLAEATTAMAQVLAAQAPRATRGMKHSINAIARGTLDRAAAQAAHEASYGSAELTEGLSALAAKRRPNFMD